MNFHESADRDFSIQFCEYNYSNPDYDQIYRPNGSGDYLFLLFKTPMKVYLDKKLSISKENACMESHLTLFFIRETVKRSMPASGSFTKNI